MDETQIAKRYYVSGMVQGIGYRYFAQRAARGLGLAGYTRNLTDGRVEIYAIGADASLAALRAQLTQGPRAAEVSGIIEEEADIQERFARGFSIEYDA